VFRCLRGEVVVVDKVEIFYYQIINMSFHNFWRYQVS
jgi:hypothetical protein